MKKILFLKHNCFKNPFSLPHNCLLNKESFFSAQPNKDNLFVENVTMVGKAIKYKRNLKVAVLPSYLTAYCLVCFPPDFPHTSHAERTAPFSSVSLSAIVQVWQINPVHIVST